MDNMVLDTILSRSSIRAYADAALTDYELDVLKKAALAAPTAMNKQEQRFIFVEDPAVTATLDKLVFDKLDEKMRERITSRGGKVLYGAPLVVIVCAAPSLFSPVDGGIAVESIVLAAKSIGLDSVILGMPAVAFDGESGVLAKKLFRFPEGYEFVIAVAVGHRAMDKAPHEWDESHIIEL